MFSRWNEQLDPRAGGIRRDGSGHVEHAEFGGVGVLVAYPPVNVVSRLVREAQKAGDPSASMQVLLVGPTAIAKLKALAVRRDQRGAGLGAALLDHCRRMYARCGFMILYGQMPPTPGLDTFYRRRGFEVLDPGEGFDARGWSSASIPSSTPRPTNGSSSGAGSRAAGTMTRAEAAEVRTIAVRNPSTPPPDPFSFVSRSTARALVSGADLAHPRA